jgi:hypothetical protein
MMEALFPHLLYFVQVSWLVKYANVIYKLPSHTDLGG